MTDCNHAEKGCALQEHVFFNDVSLVTSALRDFFINISNVVLHSQSKVVQIKPWHIILSSARMDWYVIFHVFAIVLTKAFYLTFD